MLTYYHYLLSGLFAATCTTSALVGSMTSTLPAHTLSTPTEADSAEMVDVSYRGSGRVNDAPKDEQSTQKKLVAHRGSGRIEPTPM